MLAAPVHDVLRPLPLAVLSLVMLQCPRASLGSCSYVAPQSSPSDQGYSGMDKLTDPTWVAENGQANGKHMLLYAYGPMFAGRGQIGAWKYNADTHFIEFYWSKSHCMGMCNNCCSGGGGNEPGVFASSLNPSAGSSGSLVTQFAAGQAVKLPFGKVFLRQLGDKWRLEANKCYMDHIFVCSKKNFVAKGFDASMRPCDVKFTGGGGDGGGEVSMVTMVALFTAVICLTSVALRYMLLWLPPLRRRSPAQPGARGAQVAKVDPSSAAGIPQRGLASAPASMQLVGYPPQYPVLAGSAPVGAAASMPARWGPPPPMRPSRSAPLCEGGSGWPAQPAGFQAWPQSAGSAPMAHGLSRY